MAALVSGVLGMTAMVMHAQSEPEEIFEPPSNLQVLPASLPPREFKSLMKLYARDLGVSCSYCHVEERETGIIDYASDENPRKHTARVMISMLAEINDKHLSQLAGDRRYAEPVTCGQCHRGRANPQAFTP